MKKLTILALIVSITLTSCLVNRPSSYGCPSTHVAGYTVKKMRY